MDKYQLADSNLKAHSGHNHNVAQIDALLQRAGVLCAGKICWFEQVKSTNSWLMAQQDVHARVCLTEWQSAGRGRRGRKWQAQPASSVLLSIGWRLGGSVSGLSLVSGLAVVDGLRRLGVTSLALKWPNDVLVVEQDAPQEASAEAQQEAIGKHYGGKKLGGVLTELKGENAVVGIGINVNMSHAGYRDMESAPLGENWVDLESLGYSVTRDALAASIIVSHCDYLQRFCAGGFAQFAEQWNRLNRQHGKLVSVETKNESFCGIVQGVDQHGALIVMQDGVERRLVSSEVTLRSVHAT